MTSATFKENYFHNNFKHLVDLRQYLRDHNITDAMLSKNPKIGVRLISQGMGCKTKKPIEFETAILEYLQEITVKNFINLPVWEFNAPLALAILLRRYFNCSKYIRSRRFHRPCSSFVKVIYGYIYNVSVIDDLEAGLPKLKHLMSLFDFKDCFSREYHFYETDPKSVEENYLKQVVQDYLTGNFEVFKQRLFNRKPREEPNVEIVAQQVEALTVAPPTDPPAEQVRNETTPPAAIVNKQPVAPFVGQALKIKRLQKSSQSPLSTPRSHLVDSTSREMSVLPFKTKFKREEKIVKMLKTKVYLNNIIRPYKETNANLRKQVIALRAQVIEKKELESRLKAMERRENLFIEREKKIEIHEKNLQYREELVRLMKLLNEVHDKTENIEVRLKRMESVVTTWKRESPKKVSRCFIF